MADAVTKRVIIDTPTHYVIHMTNICDGTGEAAVVKADKSTLVAATGLEPTSLEIERVRWAMQGFTNVRLLWDHTTDDMGLVLSGNGYDEFTGADGAIEGGSYGTVMRTKGLQDPRTAGDTGDVLLTTAGNTSGSTYDITLWLRKTV